MTILHCASRTAVTAPPRDTVVVSGQRRETPEGKVEVSIIEHKFMLMRELDLGSLAARLKERSFCTSNVDLA